MRDILALALEIEQPPGRLLPVRVFGTSYGSAVKYRVCARCTVLVSMRVWGWCARDLLARDPPCFSCVCYLYICEMLPPYTLARM